MDIEALIGYPFLSAAAIHFACAIFLFSRDRKSKALGLAQGMAVLCGLTCLAAGIAYIRASLGLSPGFFYRTTWIGAITMAVGSQMIALLVGSYHGTRRTIIQASYVLWTAAFIACLATDGIETGIASLVPFVDRSGPLEHPLRLIAAVQGLWIMAMAARHRKRAVGYAREQVNYFFAGGIVFVLGIVLAAFVPPLGNRTFDPILMAYLTLPWVVAVTYAVSRLRLSDIQVALAKAAAATLIVAVIGALHVNVFFLLGRILGTTAGIILATLITAVIVFGVPILPAMRSLGDNLTAKRTARREACLRESSHALGSLLSIDALLQKTLDMTTRGLGVEDAGLFLPDEEGAFQLRVAAGGMRRVRGGLSATSLLAQFLDSGQAVAVREEMEVTMPGQDFQPIASEFDALEAEAAAAMTFQKALKGIILLGRKADRRALYPADIDFLETVAARAAASIDNARLFEEATTDGLTKMRHRKYFLSRLRAEIARVRRHRRRLAVLFIDIDHFKKINDERGHLVGDQILRDIAALMLKHCREEDLICRYGGDEFVVLLADIRTGEGMKAAERLRRTVEGTPTSQAIRLTISVGVREYGDSDAVTTDEVLLGEADAALYEAKKYGRNRVVAAPLLPTLY